jgi:hypothetical protein
MPWRSNEPDPLEDMRRKLAEQEKLLSEKLARLNQGFDPSAPSDAKPTEPPVWRLEEDRTSDPLPVRRRNLARQRQRDMLLFFIAVGVLVIVVCLLIWVAYVRNTAPGTGP